MIAKKLRILARYYNLNQRFAQLEMKDLPFSPGRGRLRRTWGGVNRKSMRRGIYVILLLSVFLGPLLYYGAYFATCGPLPSRVERIAHRGAPVSAPENSLAAFREAARHGADRLELDVQLTADGVPVVFHDPTLEALTGEPRPFRTLNFEALRALDLSNGEKVPTFEEVVHVAKRLRAPLLVDIKIYGSAPEIERKVLRILHRRGKLKDAVIQSFDNASLKRVRALEPSVPLCRLYKDDPFKLEPPPPGVDCVGFPALFVAINPWLISTHHKAKRRVLVWFNEEASSGPLVRFVRALGADALVVNDLSLIPGD